MKIGLWRPLAFMLLLGAVVFGFRHVQPAHAFSSPTYYPVQFNSYAGVPCPTSITVNGQSLNLGNNCSALFNTAAMDPISQSDPQGQSVVIGPFVQVCKDGSVKQTNLPTWRGTVPGHNYSSGQIRLGYTQANLCPGYGTYQFTLMINSSSYGDGEIWTFRLMLT
jgi:hypothetical protein